jgi:dTDP-4-dehydrorhamnose reductase
MRILLFGRSGQVGFELSSLLAQGNIVDAPSRSECDLLDDKAISARIDNFAPDAIINAAAYTAVDRAESEKDIAYAVNAEAVRSMAAAAARSGALLVHYSTDYVFDGLKLSPYVEADAPNPQSVYGASKLQGEREIEASGCRFSVLRTSWVVGANGGNFAKTVLRLAKEREQLDIVADQFGVPTTAPLIADVTRILLNRWQSLPHASFPVGIYHLASDGETNWYNYAKHILAAARARGLELRVNAEDIRPISSAEYRAAAPRPRNSRLDTKKIRDTFGVDLPAWDVGLEEVLEKIFE